MNKLIVFCFFALSLLAAADVAGKWSFVWQTPGGERRSTLTFAVENDKLRVDFPGAKEPLNGKVEGDQVTVSGGLYSSEAGTTGEFRLSGKLSDGVMKGTASWDEHQMTFEAKKAE